MEVTPVGLQHKCSKKNQLTTQDKLDISYKVIIGKDLTADVAKEYRLTTGRVS